MTLRQGHERTGIPVSTLRKWAIAGNLSTYMEETPVGQLRMISLQGVYDRAAELGREVSGQAPAIVETATPPAAAAAVSRHRPAPAAPQPDPDVPPGTTLVPLDAWNKMLLQLGNLHEAGQQLAEASARAAKAETEAAFLKERLAELRAELAQARQHDTAQPDTPEPERREMAEPTGTLAMLRQIYASWRARPGS